MNIKTIEEKAKAYDEALNWMRELYPGLHGATKEDAEHYFPELCESEDEIARKWLVALVENLGEPADEDAEKELEEMRPLALAYLEKQKEQKPVEKKIALNGFEKALDSFLFDFAHSSITDCEPKEYIKNHSTYLIKAAYKELNAQLKQDLFEAQQEGRREGYEAAKNELKPTEWSEEDDKMLVGIIERGSAQIPPREPALRGEQMEWLMNRLKSLRPQPHWKPSEQEKGALRTAIHILTEERSFPKAAGHLQAILDAFEGKESRKDWKPSEEQMNYLCAAVDAAIRKHNESVSGYEPAIVLKSLYEQLQKLM